MRELVDPIVFEGLAPLRPTAHSVLPAVAITLLVGVVAAYNTTLDAHHLALLTSSLGCLLLSLGFAMLSKHRGALARATGRALILLFSFTIGVWSVTLDYAGQPSELLPSGHGVAILTVESGAQLGSQSATMLARLERVSTTFEALRPTDHQVLLKVPPDLALRPGDRIAAKVTIRGPRPELVPGGYRESPLMNRWGVDAIVSIFGPVVRLDTGPNDGWAAILEAHRRGAFRLLEHYSTKKILPAIALGQAGRLDPQVRSLFARCGLAHVTAVSGLHFGFVAWLVFFIAKRVASLSPRLLKSIGGEPLAVLLTLPLLVLYVIYVGAPVSAKRAFVMAAVLLIGKALRREGSATISLSIAAIILALWHPGEVLSPGFQLSFAAVVGLLATRHWGAGLLERLALGGRLSKLVGWLMSGLIATLGASIATTPLVILHFRQVPLVGSIANLWVVPVISLVLLPLSLVATVFSTLVPSLAVGLAWMAGQVEEVLVRTVSVYDQMAPLVSVETGHQPTEIVAVYAVLCLSLLFIHLRGAKWVFAIAAMALCSWHVLVPTLAEQRLVVSFISVGQGSSTLVEFPNGETLLVDGGGETGGAFDPGERLINPYLDWLGHDRVDRVVLTHPDADHLAGLISVIEAKRPREVWTNGDVLTSPLYLKFLFATAKVWATLKVVDDSDELDVGGVHLDVLWPARGMAQMSRNNRSVVLKLTYGNSKVLLTGDAEQEAESEMLRRGVDLSAQIMSAGHHGSRTASSSSFLAAVSPSWVVYSMGAGNKFKFPHWETMKRVHSVGASEIRTDLAGTVRVSTDGASLDVTTWYQD